MALVLAFLFFGAAELFQQGLALLKDDDVAGARVALEQAVKLAPGEPMMWLGVAEARLRMEEFALAGQAAAQAGKLAPADPMVRKGQAMFARRMGEWGQSILEAREEKKAEAVLREAIRVFGREPELHRLLGLALYAQGRNTAAVTEFLAAIDLAPEEESLYAGLETLLPAGKAVEVRLAKYAARHPGSAMGWYLLGLERGDAALWEKALQLDAKFWPAAYALSKRVDAGRAVSLLEGVVELNPEYAPAYYSLAQHYGKRGEREKAAAARKRHHELSK